MPVYSFECPQHGVFDLIQEMNTLKTCLCPRCGRASTRRMSTPARIAIVEREKLPLGTGSRGRFVSHEETGGMDIFVPSWGAMEKEEVDYVTQGAVEKEKARVRKSRAERRTQKQIGALMEVAYAQKPGGRAKTIKEAMKELR